MRQDGRHCAMGKEQPDSRRDAQMAPIHRGTQAMHLRMMAFLAALILFVPEQVRAEVKPHALCSEGMVLQQKSQAKIWGKADPGEVVTVTFRDQKHRSITDDKGNWMVSLLKTGEAGGPFEMTIS